MRLEEQSGVSRPYAYADPRSLSQAWYDALYGARRTSASEPREHHERAAVAEDGRAERETHRVGWAESADAPHDEPAGARAPRVQSRTGAGGVTADRAERTRAARMPPAGDAAADRPERANVRTDVTLRDAQAGDVRLLVRQSGESVEVTAVCDPHAGERVAEALASARAALAARGIRLAHRTIQRGDA